jgi:hypothetical protein
MSGKALPIMFFPRYRYVYVLIINLLPLSFNGQILSALRMKQVVYKAISSSGLVPINIDPTGLSIPWNVK